MAFVVIDDGAELFARFRDELEVTAHRMWHMFIRFRRRFDFDLAR